MRCELIASAKKTSDNSLVLSPSDWRAVRCKASRLVGKAGLRPHDREDIEQDLVLRLWRSKRTFDPALGCHGAFVATVLDRAANSLLRLRSSRKRGINRPHRSLTVRPGNSDAPEGAAMSRSTACSSHESAVDLAHDVSAIIGQLPPDLRELAESLKYHSVTDIARRVGISRSTVYTRLGAIRAAFAAAGMKNLSP
jgi:RNA polymerase sigma factor (sigma-70 family)